ncbi:unnamed protein product [Acanthoscelides obtectus]|uniref:C2H2-type domain-containing protein n=2 Tax=Acanthoscelides obtectus TaxID=200917 RepID=A0A9P0LNN3_ACAOB|nr:unnamed protein product [Acanthoscelides obtectus]CAK1667812.1 Zinc finger protein 26 [Acanthoscelides obtectus]
MNEIVKIEPMEHGYQKVKTEATETDSNMYSADLEYKDFFPIKDELVIKNGDSKVETETQETVLNIYSADFGYKDVKIEADDMNIKAERTEDDPNTCSVDFKLTNEELDIKEEDEALSRKVSESDLNQIRPGGHCHEELSANLYSNNYYNDINCDKFCPTNPMDDHSHGTCVHCNEEFTSETHFDDHIKMKHPEFAASVSNNIHECIHCAHKTTSERELSQHMLKHKTHLCIYCNSTFRLKVSLDEHVIKKHPEFIELVSSKIHECKYCTYKTAKKDRLDKHIYEHSPAEGSYEYNTCIHCNATFKIKRYLDNHTIKKHPDFISSVSTKIHNCKHCAYKTIYKKCLTLHMLKHTADSYSMRICCRYCNATYIYKRNLEDHILKKHPEFIASVSSKIHECKHCTYKTTFKQYLIRHMLKHSAADYPMRTKCSYCNATYTTKMDLDEHMLEMHSEFIALASSTIHECKHCSYKTSFKQSLTKHMLKHSAPDYPMRTKCSYCNATYTTKMNLDEHILRKHPEFTVSVSSKIYECKYCTYKTTRKHRFAEHMYEHSEAEVSYESNTCIHCNETFRQKLSLDVHVIKKHPEFISSVSSKVYECFHCAYKTIYKNHLAKHVLKHSWAEGSYEHNTCIHCNATFKTKEYLDNHTIKKHPDVLTSVSSKIHQCKYCTYKTTIANYLTKHMRSHPPAESTKCSYCNITYKTKRELDEHTLSNHLDLISTVSSKIRDCKYCTYKTTYKKYLTEHMLEHPTAEVMRTKCSYCNATYTSKTNLDEHTLTKHPGFTSSVSSKIHECKYCTYKTTLKHRLAKHIYEHPEADASYNYNTCVHCNAKFRLKLSLDYHVIKKHPEFVASVSSQIHECEYCSYKTTGKQRLAKHVLKHSLAEGSKPNTCKHCYATFKLKSSLDYHVAKKHPEFVASVSCKVHECKHCPYKTNKKRSLAKHIVKHSQPEGSYEQNTCIHCNATFKTKGYLDNHTNKEHSGIITSVSGKIQ